MTLERAREILQINQNDALDEQALFRQYCKRAKETHPDSNNNIDYGFSEVAEAYKILKNHLKSRDGKSAPEIDTYDRYAIIIQYIITSDVFGIYNGLDNKNIQIILENLGTILMEKNFSKIEEYIKELIIQIFQTKYKKSYALLGIDTEEEFFKNLRKKSTSLEDAYILLSIKFQIFNEQVCRCLQGILRRNKEYIFFVRDYVVYLAENGQRANQIDFINFINNVAHIEKKGDTTSGNENNNNSEPSKTPKWLAQIEPKITSEFHEGDIVFRADVQYDFGPLRFGILVNENGNLLVRNYIFANQDAVFTEKFKPNRWEKFDEFVEHGFLYGCKAVNPRFNDATINGILVHGEYILVANHDYTRFAITSSLYSVARNDHMYTIGIWPPYLSKEEIKALVKSAVTKICLSDYQGLPQPELPENTDPLVMKPIN